MRVIFSEHDRASRKMSDSALNFEGETITLYELLERSARTALNLQRKDGSFPPGRNGAYEEPETPVRTTSHWLTTLSKVYEITGEEEFADAANDAADYLLSEEARPYKYTFHSRNAEGKDKCDGLVGQAAPIRGLARAGSILERPELLEVAKKVFFLHPFDARLGLWQKVEIDGMNLSFDRTLNHQILFAGAAAHLASEYPSVEKTIKQFVQRLEFNIDTRSDGIIRHYVGPPLSKLVRYSISNTAYWRLIINDIISHLYTISPKQKRKEIGYHPANLLGISHIQRNINSIDIQKTNENLIDKIVLPDDFSKQYLEEMYYGGMTPGIDIALALHTFQINSSDEVQYWIEVDLKNKYDINTGLLSRATNDPYFQAATVSYAVDLPNQELKIR